MSKDYIPRYIVVSSKIGKKNLDAQNIIGQLAYRQRYKGFCKFTRRGSLLRCIVEHQVALRTTPPPPPPPSPRSPTRHLKISSLGLPEGESIEKHT